MAAFATQEQRERDDAKPLPQSDTTVATTMIEKLQSYGLRVTVTGILGYCTGVAARRAVREVATYVGVGIASMQLMAHYGFITIHWGTIVKTITLAADQNGDGQFDATDAVALVKKSVRFLSRGVPDAAGFVTGLYYGFRNC